MSSYLKQPLIAYTLLFIIFLTGCGSNLQDKQFTPIILDEANILNREILKWLKNYNYPKGFPFIIRTVNTLPRLEVGSKADEYFETDASRCPDPDACKKRGIYILLSREPALIQVRAGSEIALQLRWKGITAGPAYLQKQSVVSFGNFDGGLRGMVEWLSLSIPEGVKVPWYKKWFFYFLIQDIWFEFDQLSLPSESFYSSYILRPFVQARVIESRLTKTWWLTYVIAAFVIHILTATVGAFVNFIFRKWSTRMANSINLILRIVFSIVFAVPSAASMVLLSGSRLEDRIALQAWGIPGIENFTFSAKLFNMETGFALALIVIVVRWVKDICEIPRFIVLYSGLSDEMQQIVFEKLKEEEPFTALMLEGYALKSHVFSVWFERSPIGSILGSMLWDNFKRGIIWGLLSWLFLPKAFSLMVVYIWLPQVVVGLPKFIITVRQADLISKRL
jgi:hypothetical protein